MSELFTAKQLEDIDGMAVPPATLDGRIVGLYFTSRTSSHCREFTAELAAFCQDDSKAGHLLKVVYVPLDPDPEPALAGVENREMPSVNWLILAPRARIVRAALADKMGVRSIPTLVVLDERGEVVTKEGRDLMARGIPVDKWRASVSENTGFAPHPQGGNTFRDTKLEAGQGWAVGSYHTTADTHTDSEVPYQAPTSKSAVLPVPPPL